MDQYSESIQRLRRQRNAVILCHSYQPAAIQDLADYVGDSYGLSKTAAEVEADVIVFCGVLFMAETAAILNPGRKVIMPDRSAGCPMADMITAAELRALKAKHPKAAVVCYVNSTAEVKAESTICCTSSNAVQIVNALADVEEIIFVPDRYLGRFVERQTGRKLILWDGFCPTHGMIRPDVIAAARAEHPQAQVMVHPECTPEVQDLADHLLSTGQMCELVQRSDCQEFIVGTEQGIMHTLAKLAPTKHFYHLSTELVCPNMKKTTMAKLAACLETLSPEIVVPEAIADPARTAIEAMLRVVERG